MDKIDREMVETRIEREIETRIENQNPQGAGEGMEPGFPEGEVYY